MTENSNEAPTGQIEDTALPGMSDEDRAASQAEVQLVDAPKDAPENTSTGFAVFDRTVGQYVPGIHKGRPSSTDARKAVPDGHTAAVVRV